jgi:two-component system chemotaxis response regulator CheY
MQALVIDDSRAMRGILKRTLVKLGFEVREGTDGADGLARLTEQAAPDLVLVDWNMPNMNGLDFVKAVRARPAYDAMPVVMVTTEVEMTQLQAALAAGASEYVMKPFTEQALTDKIRMLGFAAEAA